MESKSHTTEVMQKTRIELENGDISTEEIDDSIRVRCSIFVSGRFLISRVSNLPFLSTRHQSAGLSIPSQAVRMHARRPRYYHVGAMGMDEGRGG
jgi:hypothetical protein